VEAFIGAGVEGSGRGRRRNDRRWGGFNGRVIRAHHGGLRRDLKGGGGNGQGVKEEGEGLAPGRRATMVVEARRRETETVASVRLEEEEGRSGHVGQTGQHAGWLAGPKRAGWAGREAEAQWGGGGQQAGWAKG
jgi:hypothetical protein